MIIKNSLREYFRNFSVSLLFGILLIFTAFFALFSNFAFSSGSIFMDYSLNFPLHLFFVQFVGMFIFLFFYSFFVSLIVFAVRRNLSIVRVEFYLQEMVKKFTSKIFVFYSVFTIGLFFLSLLLISIGVNILVVNLFLLVISLFFVFIPQAIVVEELSLSEAVSENFRFLKEDKKSFLIVITVGVIITAVIPFIEIFFDFAFPGLFIGRFVSLFIMLVFAVPFIETLKTYLYMMKYDLIKKSQLVDVYAKPKKFVAPKTPAELGAKRLRDPKDSI